MGKKAFHRILITGAAGELGGYLRGHLKEYADIIRISDVKAMEDHHDSKEEIVVCDLADKKAVMDLVKGVDAVVHFGAIPSEHSFEDILGPNICGTYHIYEAAREHGVKRVVFASTMHVVGFYRRGEILETDCKRKPDGYYALSKAYGEEMAEFYWNRYGIETVSLRIGFCFPEPPEILALPTWCSYRDLGQITVKGLITENVGHTIAFAVSNNPNKWWSNRLAGYLDFIPKDSSAPYVDKVLKACEGKPEMNAGPRHQGGLFSTLGPFNDKETPKFKKQVFFSQLGKD